MTCCQYLGTCDCFFTNPKKTKPLLKKKLSFRTQLKTLTVMPEPDHGFSSIVLFTKRYYLLQHIFVKHSFVWCQSWVVSTTTRQKFWFCILQLSKLQQESKNLTIFTINRSKIILNSTIWAAPVSSDNKRKTKICVL